MADRAAGGRRPRGGRTGDDGPGHGRAERADHVARLEPHRRDGRRLGEFDDPHPRLARAGRVGADRLCRIRGQHPPPPARARPPRCDRRDTAAARRHRGRRGRDPRPDRLPGRGRRRRGRGARHDAVAGRPHAAPEPAAHRRRGRGCRPDRRRLPRRDDCCDRAGADGLARARPAGALGAPTGPVARAADPVVRPGRGWPGGHHDGGRGDDAQCRRSARCAGPGARTR